MSDLADVYYTDVEPYVGAWIETQQQSQDIKNAFVAPYVGAWIETCKHLNVII